MSADEKGLFMKLWDAGIFIGLAIAILVGIGWVTKHITKVDDHPVEEVAEDIIENILEDTFSLPDGSLDIDLSPNSKEA